MTRLFQNQSHYPCISEQADGDRKQAPASDRVVARKDVEDVDERRPVIRDPAMRELYRVVDRVAAGTIGVLVVGETGVGKDLVATAIHTRSPRRKAPFMRVNCASVPEALFESELFGHERGAFTGALKSKPGLLELANGGTAFLDEVGELPYVVQAKLLRAIDALEIVRLGGLRAQRLDVRFVCATNRDLGALVERGAFREDLYFRLSGARLFVPPLRERRGEIEALALHLLREIAHQLGMPRAPSISPEAMSMLLEHAWPGNVRELRNTLEFAALLSTDGVIRPSQLEFRVSSPPRPANLPGEPNGASRPLEKANPANRGAAADRERILQVLALCGGNQTRAAEILGIPRRTFVARLARYGVPRPRDGR